MKNLDRVLRLAFIVTLAALVIAVYQYAKGVVLAELYEEKLAGLAAEYEAVRTRYNAAVEQSAITELVVKDGAVSVRVRGADRVLHTIPTKLDPAREIHVDFVVRDSRLFMRRLYDDRTAPADGLVVDPGLERIDWRDPAIARGLSVYRGDLAEGRWVVSSTGNGALGLTKVEDGDPVELVEAPPVRTFEQMSEDIERHLESVGTVDVVARLVSRTADL